MVLRFRETFAHAPEYISGDLPWINATGGHPSNVPWTWSGVTSLAHPWGCGPAFWMSQNLGGVRPTSPGFATFEVAPQLTASLTRVAATVPTVHGAFEVQRILPGAQGEINRAVLIDIVDAPAAGEQVVLVKGLQMAVRRLGVRARDHPHAAAFRRRVR